MNSLYPVKIVLVLGGRDSVSGIHNPVKKHGYDLLQVQSLQLVSEKLSRHHAGLIILDSQYPGFSIEGLKQLYRNYPETENIPLLLLAENKNAAAESFQKDYDNVWIAGKTDQGTILTFIDEHLKPAISIKFWGVRGSVPTPGASTLKYGGNTTCIQVLLPFHEELLILDSGTGIRNLGNSIERHLDNRAKGHLFITHSHRDHIEGLPFFKPFYGVDNHFQIHMPEQHRGGTKEILSSYLSAAFAPLSLDMLSAEIDYITQDEDLTRYTGYGIEYMIANHPAKTAIYKIHAENHTIVFAPDNELNRAPSPIRFMEKFEEFITGCDLLIHDSQYSSQNYRENVGKGHSAWEFVIDVAKRCHVKRLCLTHHDPDSTDEQLTETDKKLKSYRRDPFLEIRIAKEGSIIRLPL